MFKSLWHGFLRVLRFLYRITFYPIVKIFYNRLIKPIFEIKDSPHSIALGVAVGLWVALIPAMGIQMTIALVLCTIVRANVLVAVAMCWITNPVTFVPWYYACYRTGLVVTSTKPMQWEEFKDMIQNNYVIVSNTHPVAKDEEQNIEELKKAEELCLFYTPKKEQSKEKVRLWCESNNIRIRKWNEVKGKFTEVIDELKKQKGYGVIDQQTYRKLKKKDPLCNIQFVAEINAERDGWDQFMLVLLLGLTDIAGPLWIGGLILATLIAPPFYPITYRSIVKFRTSIQHIKEKRRMTARIKIEKRMESEKLHSLEKAPTAQKPDEPEKTEKSPERESEDRGKDQV